jgi:LPXTG-motif cell wall-anchored protein
MANTEQNIKLSPLSEQELMDLIIGAVGTISIDDKPTLVYMLQKNGSLITEVNTQSEILDATFKAIRDSNSFRQDLTDYLVSQGELMVEVDEENAKFSNVVKEGGTAVGNWFRTAGKNLGQGIKKVGSAILTKENVEALSSIGIGYLGASLQAKAQRGQGQQAIDYTNSQANLEALKLKQLEASQQLGGGFAPTGEKKNKWVLPVAIGGGLLLLGTILFFAFRKKN